MESINAAISAILPTVGILAAIVVMFTRAAPQTVSVAQFRAMAEYTAQLIASLRADNEQLKVDVRALKHDNQLLFAHIAALTDQVIQSGRRPVTLMDTEKAQNQIITEASKDKVRLLKILQTRFTIDEIEGAGWAIGVLVGTLGVGALNERARALVDWCASRDGMLMQLALEIERQKPKALDVMV